MGVIRLVCSMSKKFAEGICFKKMFWVFLIASIIGVIYEEIYTIIWNYILHGVFEWSPRRGVIWGPINPIYGFGAVFMSLALVNKNDKWYISFLKTAFIGGAFEYLCSYFQEKFLHTIAWDYSGFFLNIGGRTTVPYMIIWGIFGVLFVKYIYPFISNRIESIPLKPGVIITNVLIVLLSLDMIISWVSLGRQSLRKEGIEPYTFIGEYCDKYFTDDYLNKHFPNTMNRRN